MTQTHDNEDEIADAVRRACDRDGWAVLRLAEGDEVRVRFERVEIRADEKGGMRTLTAPFIRRDAGDKVWISGVLLALEQASGRWWAWATWLVAGLSVIDDERARVESVEPAGASEIVG